VPAGEAEKEVKTSMVLLRKAVAMGFRSPDTYRTDEALDPLRGRDDFKLLMMDLAIPAEPFAPALTAGPLTSHRPIELQRSRANWWVEPERE
jgi:hypothetical protein